MLYKPDNRGGARQFWASDRGAVSGAISEPATSLNIPVQAGRYRIHLGDGGLTPPMAALGGPIRPMGTPYVRIWFRPGRGEFQVMEPDLPLDAAPLAREAAWAGDADRLEGKRATFFLERGNHLGAEATVSFNGAPSWKFMGDFPLPGEPVSLRPDEYGCGEYVLARVRGHAPTRGVVVVLAHANLIGVARPGSGAVCLPDETTTVRVCVPAPDAPPPPDRPGSPSVPGMPQPGSVPPPSLPTPGAGGITPPALGGGRGVRAWSIRTLSEKCLPGEVTVEQHSQGSRFDGRGGRARLMLVRPDQPPGQRVVSATDSLDFESNVLTGLRMDASTTFEVQAGAFELELRASLLSSAGFGERNLTAVFIPTR